MGLLQLQFGGILAGDHPLGRIDKGGETVEERRLARAGAAGNEHVAANMSDNIENGGTFGRDRLVLHEIGELQPILLEFADGERRSVDR